MQLLLPASLLTVTLSAGAAAWSPSGSYAPGEVSCPSDINLVRNASGLSTDEQDWLKKRDANTRDSLKSFLTKATKNFSDSSLLDDLFKDENAAPRIGIAASGGGYRAMLAAGGMVAAMDNRTEGANEHGLGGLLQSSTYFAGLSGGNWLTSTLAWNNWTSIQEILDQLSTTNSTSIWAIENSLIAPGGSNKTLTNEIFGAVKKEVDQKQAQGYNVTFVDIWGRVLSRFMFPTYPNSGDALTFSTLRDFDVFKNAEMPFPISILDGEFPDEDMVHLNATVYEANPFEFGTWDSSLRSFTDIKYLGTDVNNGAPVNDGQCVSGFDNVGFIMGTSSDVFNGIENTANGKAYTGVINSFIKQFLPNATMDKNIDVGMYAPNPFKGIENGNQSYAALLTEVDALRLVDGGENGESIPFAPLIQQEREVDVVFALDISDDTEQSWPDGSSIINTYRRQFTTEGQFSAFPYVPDNETFVKDGLNKKPTFFGCDAKNLTGLRYTPPLIVYVPNTEYSFASNTSTLQLNYEEKDIRNMIQNGFESMTMGNFTKDSEFIGCIGCAIMRRKQESQDLALPEECNKCFSNYCWGGFDAEASVSAQNTTGSNATWSNSTSASSVRNGTATSTLIGSVDENSSRITAMAAATGGNQTSSGAASSSTSTTRTRGGANVLNAGSTLGVFFFVNVLLNFL
ncbi:uncharacterized protein KNAG_0K00530 [Huiozyma naganishii CBS 8797]|uniref:Lysophospholipase n=1 Tax=Huiozyma naganishii (strain ATCC MYA-139 / BCRC 22969 / CBS 8797 / KCTC 17520 / NBRC 10181 / NCYC 3082 / Yp74L-3) TaxID=1071383 RepID=J7SAR6_HUIN7|nr:hypothetical protein KNAG_0K00530 [Kazachstania naganishii CBS 8797]CCK72421.1 hypothetical protein KNAG_0K00530 [Kazachstania naganishii CBS 8797]